MIQRELNLLHSLSTAPVFPVGKDTYVLSIAFPLTDFRKERVRVDVDSM